MDSSNDIEKYRDQIVERAERGEHLSAVEMLIIMEPSLVVRTLEALSREARCEIFKLLPMDTVDEIFFELLPETQQELVSDLDDERLVSIITELDADDAVELLGLMDDERKDAILGALSPEKRDELVKLLGLPDDTAGAMMEPSLLRLPETERVGEAVRFLRRYTDDIEEVFNIYLVDDDGKLTGVVPVQRLLVARYSTSLKDLADPPVSVPIGMDQEDVAELFRRNDIVSAPVVDADGKLRGRITVDDVVDVVDDEATEDTYRMAGMGDEEETLATFHNIKARLPWLLVSLGGEVISGLVLKHFSYTFKVAIILASFVPLIMALGGNVGNQSAVVLVRRLALYKGSSTRWLRRAVAREIGTGFFLGILFGVALFVVGYIWGAPKVGIAAALGMLSAMTISSTVGSITPIVLRKINIDPAYATPFISTFNDIVGLSIYFLIATVLLIKL